MRKVSPHGLEREEMVPIPRFGMRCDFLFGELPHNLAEGLVLLAQVKIHFGMVCP